MMDGATRTAEVWDEAPPAADASAAPLLSVAGFEGPLDWLLEMVRAQRIELAKLSILALVDAFMDAFDAALRQRAQFDLARWADWTVMAAHLALLRSRLLLPPDAPEARAAYAEAEAWRRALLGRAQIRGAAEWLGRRNQLGRDVFIRGSAEAETAGARTLDITDLFRACLVVLRTPELAETYRPLPPRLWCISDAMGRMRRMLGEGWSGGELAAFLPRLDLARPEHELRCRAALASTLVAGLELAREGALALEQERPWQPVRVSV